MRCLHIKGELGKMYTHYEMVGRNGLALWSVYISTALED